MFSCGVINLEEDEEDDDGKMMYSRGWAKMRMLKYEDDNGDRYEILR